MQRLAGDHDQWGWSGLNLLNPRPTRHSVGFDPQLFVDEKLVSELENAELQIRGLEKQNGGRAVIVRDRPWEEGVLGHGISVEYHQNKFRMWYRCVLIG